MNVEEFYKNLKESLSFVGLKFGDMGEATIHIYRGSVVIGHGSKSTSFRVNPVADRDLEDRD